MSPVILGLCELWIVGVSLLNCLFWHSHKKKENSLKSFTGQITVSDDMLSWLVDQPQALLIDIAGVKMTCKKGYNPKVCGRSFLTREKDGWIKPTNVFLSVHWPTMYSHRIQITL